MSEKKEVEVKEKLIRLKRVDEIRRFGSLIEIIYLDGGDPECVEY